jgi:hypothetical protein
MGKDCTSAPDQLTHSLSDAAHQVLEPAKLIRPADKLTHIEEHEVPHTVTNTVFNTAFALNPQPNHQKHTRTHTKNITA